MGGCARVASPSSKEEECLAKCVRADKPQAEQRRIISFFIVAAAAITAPGATAIMGSHFQNFIAKVLDALQKVAIGVVALWLSKLRWVFAQVAKAWE